MPLFTKLETKSLVLTGVSNAYPPVYDYVSGDENNYPFPAPPEFQLSFTAFDDFAGKMTTYVATPDNWAVGITEAIIIPETILGVGYVPFYGANAFFGGAAGEYVFAVLGYSIFEDGTVQADIPVSFDLRENITCAFDSWNFLNTYENASFGPAKWGTLGAIEYNDALGTTYTIAAIFDPGTASLTLYNAYAGPLNLFPKANFEVSPGEYLTIGSNTNESGYGINQITWTPEPIGNWLSGTFSDVWEVITLDDAELQSQIDADFFYINNFAKNADRFFVSVTDDSYSIIGVLEVFPLSGTYNVLLVESGNALADELMPYLENITYNSSADNYTVFGTDGDGAPLWATTTGGVIPPPVAALSVPRYVAVKLPCFVNCVPVIDKRK